MAEATGGEREIIVSASTLEEVLKFLSLKYGDAIRPWVSPFARIPYLLNFFVNGVQIKSLEQLGATLKDGDVIVILPTVHGG